MVRENLLVSYGRLEYIFVLKKTFFDTVMFVQYRLFKSSNANKMNIFIMIEEEIVNDSQLHLALCN